MAVENNDTEIVKLILSRDYVKANILSSSFQKVNDDLCEKTVMTPLHIAVLNKNTKIVKLLLAVKNININIVDGKGKKPAEYAIHNKKIECMLQSFKTP